VVSSTPRSHFTPGKNPVPTLQAVGWAPGPMWTGGKSRPHRDSIPDRPARSQSLYRLSYPTHYFLLYNYLFIYLFIESVMLHETQRELYTHSGYCVHLFGLTNLTTYKQALVETLQLTDHRKTTLGYLIPWARVLLDKPTVPTLCNAHVSCNENDHDVYRKLAIYSYCKPDESNPHPHILLS